MPRSIKNGKNRDGNEKARKGLGCTNRSIRMDWFGRGKDGIYSPTGNKIARQEPVAPMDDVRYPVEDGSYWGWWS